MRIRADARRPRFPARDRKSTRLNSSHTVISYAVFCLKKKNVARGRFCRHLNTDRCAGWQRGGASAAPLHGHPASPRSDADLADVRLFYSFVNDTAATEIYTLSLHDALPI